MQSTRANCYEIPSVEIGLRLWRIAREQEAREAAAKAQREDKKDAA